MIFYRTLMILAYVLAKNPISFVIGVHGICNDVMYAEGYSFQGRR